MPACANLFVYGSLLSGARHEMGRRLHAGASLVGPALMPGRLFDLGAWPGATHEPEGARMVLGEVWHMRQPSRLLRQLDVYEGCAPGQPQPHAFRRELVEVVGEGNRTLPAWVYIWTGDIANGRAVAGGDWLLHVAGRRQRPASAQDRMRGRK